MPNFAGIRFVLFGQLQHRRQIAGGLDDFGEGFYDGAEAFQPANGFLGPLLVCPEIRGGHFIFDLSRARSFGFVVKDCLEAEGPALESPLPGYTIPFPKQTFLHFLRVHAVENRIQNYYGGAGRGAGGMADLPDDPEPGVLVVGGVLVIVPSFFLTSDDPLPHPATEKRQIANNAKRVGPLAIRKVPHIRFVNSSGKPADYLACRTSRCIDCKRWTWRCAGRSHPP